MSKRQVRSEHLNLRLTENEKIYLKGGFMPIMSITDKFLIAQQAVRGLKDVRIDLNWHWLQMSEILEIQAFLLDQNLMEIELELVKEKTRSDGTRYFAFSASEKKVTYNFFSCNYKEDLYLEQKLKENKDV